MGQQWRFTWMGSPEQGDGRDRISTNLIHNGGVIVASTACASDLDLAVWPGAVVCNLKIPILLFGNESLVEEFQNVDQVSYKVVDVIGASTIWSLAAVTVKMWPPSALAGFGESIRFMVVNVSFSTGDVQRTHTCGRYSQAASEKICAFVSAFLVKHRDDMPRIIMVNLGDNSPSSPIIMPGMSPRSFTRRASTNAEL